MRVNSCNKLPSISPANAVREIHFGHILENADVLLKTEDISLSSFTCFYVLLCILSCLLGRGSREQTDVKTGFFGCPFVRLHVDCGKRLLAFDSAGFDFHNFLYFLP